MSNADDQTRELVDRIRALLSGHRLREQKMFGVVAVMVDDAMAVAAHKDGSLLVRVDPAEDAQLLEHPHATRPEMGGGRSMGAGWLRIDAEGLESEAALSSWVSAASRYLAKRSSTGR